MGINRLTEEGFMDKRLFKVDSGDWLSSDKTSGEGRGSVLFSAPSWKGREDRITIRVVRSGKNMKAVAGAIAGLSQNEILEFQSKGQLEILVNGEPVKIDLEDVEIFSEDIPGWLVANEGNLTLALDVTISDELRQEGIARDIVNRIQNLRKSRDYDITDRIKLTIEGDDQTNEAVLCFKEYIQRQVLADSIEIANGLQVSEEETFDIDGLTVKVRVELAK